MQLSLKEKIGYGLGDTASNFFWATMMSFLMYFYTDIFGITAAAVGTLLLFARAFDGVCDFLMGAIADRTRTRWGKFRPYLLWMGFPLAIVATLTFTTPDLSPSGKLLYAWVTYNLFMMLYSAVNIPYSALSGVMTDDPLERTSLNSYRMVLAQCGGFIVNAATLPLIAYFGQGDQEVGYQLTIALFSAMATLLFFLTFAWTRERIQPPLNQRTRIRDDVRRLFANPHWVLLFLVGIADLAFIILRAGTLVYYCKYHLHLDQAQTSFFLVLGNIGFVAGAIGTRFVAESLGKKRAFIAAHLLLAATAAGAYWTGPEQLAVVYTLQVLHGVAGGVSATLYWAMIADTADFAEWKFGVRMTGMIFSATTCSHKVGMGIGAAIAGILLAHFGYVAGDVQTTAANQGILLLISLLPAVGFLVVALMFRLYGLDDALGRKIRNDLAARRGPV